MATNSSKPIVAEWMREAARHICDNERLLGEDCENDAADIIARKHAEGCDGRPRVDSLCPMHREGKRPEPIDTGVCTYCRLNDAENLKQRVKELVGAAEQAHEAAAAAFRVAEQAGTWDALETEMERDGVVKGFGKRLTLAIARVRELVD